MSDMSERNSVLIKKVFRKYIFATIFSCMALLLGPVMNSAIVGHLLGRDALSAITLCLPFLQMSLAGVTLLGMGATVLISNELGSGNADKAQEIFTTAVLMMVLFVLGVLCFGLADLNRLTTFLCNVPELHPLVRQYLFYLLLLLPIILFSMFIAYFLRADSNPKLVTFSLFCGLIVNVAMNIILVKYFNMGIEAAALALASGFGLSDLIMMAHFLRKKKQLRLTHLGSWKVVFKIIFMGAPVAVSSILFSARLYSVNHILGDQLGETGLALLAVNLNMLMLAYLFINGFIQTLQPLGSAQIGCQDRTGFRMTVRVTISVLMICLTVGLLTLWIFPTTIAKLFGIHDIPIDRICRSIWSYSLCFWLSGLTSLCLVFYQIGGKVRMAMAVGVVESLAVIPILLLVRPLGETAMWLAFPAGEILTLAMVLIFRVPLFPIFTQKKEKPLMEFSLVHDRSKLLTFPADIAKKLLGTIPDDSMRKLMKTDILDAVEGASSNWRHMDVFIQEEENGGYQAVFLDDGMPHPERNWINGQNFLLKKWEHPVP